MDQVEEWGPPPNPAKTTDSRFADYLAMHGPSSWELDALDPPTLAGLVRQEVQRERNEELWEESRQRTEAGRERLREIAGSWHDIEEFLES